MTTLSPNAPSVHPLSPSLASAGRRRLRRSAVRCGALLGGVLLLSPTPTPLASGIAAAGQDLQDVTVVLDSGADAPGKEEQEVLPAKGTMLFLVQPRALRDSTKARFPIQDSRATDLVAASIGTFGLEPLSSSELAKRDLTWEAFAAEARKTARDHLATLKPDVKRDERGIAEHALIRSRNPATHAVIFTREFYEMFEPTLGDRLLVAIPDRYTVYVFPRSMGTFRAFGKSILAQYLDALYPASHELFEIDAEGLRAVGSFLEE